MGLFDFFNNEEEEMQEAVQDLVDRVMNAESVLIEDDPEERKKKIEEIIRKESINFAKDWCENNPDKVEKALEKAFGRDYGNSQITGQSISDGIKQFNEWEDVIDIAGNLADFIDAYGDYKFTDSDDLDVRKDALAEMTSSMLGICNTVVSKVPYIGPTLSLIVQQLSICFDAGYATVTSHLDQLKYTEAMCDYYTGAISASELVDILDSIKSIKNAEIKQIKALASMEAKFDATIRQEVYEQYGYESRATTWNSKGQEVFNSLSEEEKSKYNGRWMDNTTDETTEDSDEGLTESDETPAPRDPLVIDLGKKGIELTGLENGVHFDLDKNGFAERTAWIGEEDGFLAYDRNNNGIIDNGGELFSDQVVMSDSNISTSGFAALSDLLWGDNGNDKIKD